MNRNDDFNRDFRRTSFAAYFIVLFNIVVTCAVLGFVAWVAIALLKHFGVIA